MKKMKTAKKLITLKKDIKINCLEGITFKKGFVFLVKKDGNKKNFYCFELSDKDGNTMTIPIKLEFESNNRKLFLLDYRNKKVTAKRLIEEIKKVNNGRMRKGGLVEPSQHHFTKIGQA